MAQYAEGQRLLGSDGKHYVVRNGVPVSDSAQPLVANPKLPGELTGQSLNNQRTQQEIEQSQATAAATTAKTKAEATSAEIAAKTAQEAYAAAHPQGTGATVVGPDSLKSLSVPDQELVKALAEGRLAFPGGFALKAPWWQQKLEQVAQYDPSFDATNFNNRAKARASIVNGKVGTSSNALNTAIGHLGLLSSQIGGTASHGPWSVAGIPIPGATTVNALENFALKSSGQSGITNFQDTAQKLADELESVYRNGGGAEQGVVRQLRSLDQNASGEQKKGIVGNALDLLASKQAANLYQYNIGSGGKPGVDLLDPAARSVLDQFPDIRDKYFAQPAGALSRQAASLLQANGGQPPPPPPAGPQGGPPQVGPTGGPDYSGMTGAPQHTLATGQYRNEFDPVGAATLSAFIRKGAPYETAAAYAQSHGFNPPDPQSYAAGVAFARQHGGATNVEANRSVPTTMGERLSASPLAAGIAGAATGSTAGLSDVLGRSLAGPQWDANRAALAATNPGSDLAGNIAGGVTGMLAGEGALGKFAPGLVDAARSSRIAPFLPAATDAAYGATYGASENPQNPLGGAATGLATGVGGGMFARGASKVAGRMIAPDAGIMAPFYAQGGLPTIGQRASAMTGPVSSRVGKAINTVEQSMQSVPFLGALPATARETARKDFQRGAFNDALGELGTQLPKGAGIGPEAHSFASDTFGKAYDSARSEMQFVADPPFASDYADFSKALNDGTLTADQSGQVEKALASSLDGRLKSGGMNGADYKAAVSDIQRKAATWAGNPNTAGQAQYLTQFANILDDAARRNSDPSASALLDAADKGYAKFVRIQKASQLGGAAKDAGTFTPNNYAASVKSMGGGLRSNAYSRGDALGQDYAQAGLKLSDTLPDSGTPARLATMGLLGGAEGAALAMGHLGVSPAALGMFAPYVGRLGNRLIAPRQYTLPPIFSDPMNLVGNGIYDRSGAIGRIGAPAALSFSGQ